MTPMTRGQITIPKEYRDKLRITSKTPLNLTLEEDRIVIKPLARMIADDSPYIIKPKYTKEEYIKVLARISLYMQKHGSLWTKEDDKARKAMRKKEKIYDW